MKTRNINRRNILRGLGVGLTLPALESLTLSGFASEQAQKNKSKAKRFICVAPDYGIYPDAFFPNQSGSDYEMPGTLKLMERHRSEISIFSHLDHPGVGGGHGCTRTLLNGVTASDIQGERSRLLSLDQEIAMQIGMNTRFPALGTGSGAPISYTNAGIPVPSIPTPDRLFNLLFVDEDEQTKLSQRQSLKDNASILDVLLEDSRSLQPQLSSLDRIKLDEYLTAVRETEGKLKRRKEWIDIPKPKVRAPKQDDELAEQSGYPFDMALFYDVMVLALQTDSTRVLTYQMPGGNRMFPLEGITMGYHTLTHHGKDPEKANQIQIIDRYYFTELAKFLDKLKDSKDENGQPLLDTTIVMFGSGMGNASSHSSRDVPIMVAGGGLRHGSHHSFPKEAHSGTPLANLYVTLLNQLGIEKDQFATSEGDLNHLL